jgi:hypothetical protein
MAESAIARAPIALDVSEIHSLLAGDCRANVKNRNIARDNSHAPQAAESAA